MLKSATKFSHISPDVITLPDEMSCSPLELLPFLEISDASYEINCINVNYTRCVLGRVPLLPRQFLFTSVLGSPLQYLIISYVQSVEPWDLLKIEMFLCQENQAVWMLENIFAFDEEGLLPCAMGERNSKKESCSQKHVWWMESVAQLPDHLPSI